MNSSVDIGTFNGNDTVVQMARCSFDIHVQEILGSLMHGATVVMLRPRGTIDFEYLSTILTEKQTTYMNAVPSFYHSFFSFIKESNNQVAIKHFRSLVSGGE